MSFRIFGFILIIMLVDLQSMGQTGSISGVVLSANEPIPFASVYLDDTQIGSSTNEEGEFIIDDIPYGEYTLKVKSIGYIEYESAVSVSDVKNKLSITLDPKIDGLSEVVISGTMKEVSKTESPVPVEVYSSKFFKSNPSPSVYEAMQNVNGVRPQVNCNVCNTGDIHINGLEGPYTMVLIDGMPIVSGLSTVYGLNGIPQSLIERVEIVKGPASTLYGSEAVGGLINIITKSPTKAPLFAVDVMGTTWGEMNADVSAKMKVSNKAESLIGINYFNYSNPADHNGDNFTDVTLQDRISVFNKWNFSRKKGRVFSLAGRYVYEDRWGGEMNWNDEFRGGEDIYGESIYTSRWEMFGTYQLPLREKVFFMFSANGHDQNSVYGNTIYLADQNIGFGQLSWNKQVGRHDVLAGAALRYTYFDDNTPATQSSDTSTFINEPSQTYLPGVFIQDEITLHPQHKILAGMRYDYNSIHGQIFTPRLNYKWNSKDKSDVIRLSLGNGYRVANVFTEDHAALTGSREVVFLDDLNPETSWNVNLNYVKKIIPGERFYLGIDATAFYTYFENRIIADYDADPLLIVYDNLSGYAVSKGVSLNFDMSFGNGLKAIFGGTAMDVYAVNDGIKDRQEFTEQFTGVWNINYTFKKSKMNIAYTGNLYGPMRLPLQSELDPRQEFSPWWSIQNIQISRPFSRELELYAGVKNLLNWTPNKGNPFIIARAHDPFDRQVEFDNNGNILATPENPYALSFDPSYVYGPNQGIRFFAGLRYTLF